MPTLPAKVVATIDNVKNAPTANATMKMSRTTLGVISVEKDVSKIEVRMLFGAAIRCLQIRDGKIPHCLVCRGLPRIPLCSRPHET